MTMPVSFLVFTADGGATPGPCLLNAVYLHVSTDGGDATLYEGQDATSGRKIMQLHALANDPKFIAFPHAPFLARGLYVDVGSNVTGVTVFFTLLPIGTIEPPE